MTEKLYDLYPYESEFEAKVMEVKEEEDKTYVILDKTLFFPNEGGQVCDRGTIEEIPVQYVANKNGVHYHQIENNSKGLVVGMTVKGKIDFTHRYDLMQQHSGEHILSGIIYNTYGYSNVGFHLTEDIVTVDCSGTFTKEQMQELELKVNEVITSNQSIVCRYPSKEELATMEYRSKKEIDGAVRIVSVGDFEQCACCAPHVRTTAEVGSLRIVSYENYKGGTRMEIKCGLRASKDAIEKQNILKELMQTFSVPYKQLTEAVAKTQIEQQNLKGQLVAVMAELMELKVEKVEHSEKIILFEEGLDGNNHRNYVNLLMEKAEKLVAVLVCTGEENTYRYIIGSNVLDMKAVQEALKAEFLAKGGGKAPMIQGTLVGERGRIEEFLCNLSFE